MPTEQWNEPRIVAWSQWLLDSYRHWTGRDLITRSDPERDAQHLFDQRFVVVSHGTQPDPILNYGNRAALRLWSMTWDELVTTPSRLTAEPVDRPERERMLEVASKQGYFDGYRGVRTTTSGKRFLVEQALIWTVLDASGDRVGQAATFAHWRFLD